MTRWLVFALLAGSTLLAAPKPRADEAEIASAAGRQTTIDVLDAVNTLLGLPTIRELSDLADGETLQDVKDVVELTVSADDEVEIPERGFVRYRLFYDLGVVCGRPPCFVLYERVTRRTADELHFGPEDILAYAGIDAIQTSPILKNHSASAMDFNKLELTIDGKAMPPIEPIGGGLGEARMGEPLVKRFHWRTFARGEPVAGPGLLEIETVIVE
ncbi:MAG: hypothetical protein AAGC57_01110 [Pseudomonadota bacterium]